MGEVPKIDNMDELPVKTRKKTDFFCSIFISVYVILLALILVFVYNQGKKSISETTSTG